LLGHQLGNNGFTVTVGIARRSFRCLGPLHEIDVVVEWKLDLSGDQEKT
jgi:hypothetical protein